MQRAVDPIYPSQCVLSIFFATGEAVNDIGSEAKDFNRSFIIVRESCRGISETYWIGGLGGKKYILVEKVLDGGLKMGVVECGGHF